MRSIVAQEKTTWNLLLRIIKREHETSSSKGKGRTPKPMGNAKELFSFMGIPSSSLNPILEKILSGETKLEVAAMEARDFKSMEAMKNHFEKCFNDLMGNKPALKSRLLKANKWIKWKDIKARLPEVEIQSVIYKGHFGGQKVAMNLFDIYTRCTALRSLVLFLKGC